MFYVYKVVDKVTNEFYIGSRKFDGDNPYDDKYLGSPYTWKPNIDNLVKYIYRHDFDNMEDAISFERILIIENINNPLNRNYSIPYKRFHRSNLVTAVNNEGKIVSLNVKDPLFGKEFFGITKGKVLVRDENNNIFLISKDDERYLNGELLHNNKFIMNKGEKHQNWGKKQINNGIDQKLVSIDDIDFYLNNGWFIGTLQKGKRTVSSHYDKFWITNGESNKRIDINDLEKFANLGWSKGRTFHKKYNRNKK